MSIFHYTHISPIILLGSTSICTGKYVYLSLHTYISNYTIGKYVHLYREICLSFITHIYLQLYYREVRPSLQGNMSILHYTHISPIMLQGSTSIFIGKLSIFHYTNISSIILQGSTSIFQGNMSIFQYTHKSPIILYGRTPIFIGKYVYLSLHTYISNYNIGKYVHLYREICLSFITIIYLQLYYREVRPSLQGNMSIFHDTHISPIILQGSTSTFTGKYVYLSLHTYISNYTIGKYVHLYRVICQSFITQIYLQLYYREVRPSIQENMSIFHYTHISPIIRQGSTSIFQGNMSIFHYTHKSPIILQGSTSISIGKYVYLSLHTHISNYTIGKNAHLYREICLSFITHIYLQLYYREVRLSLQGNMSILHYTHISPIMLQGSTSIFTGKYVYLSLHTYISNYTIGKYIHLYREICISFFTQIYLQLYYREVRPSLQGNMSIFHYTHISPIIRQGSTSIVQGNMTIFHYTHKSPIIPQGSTSLFIGKYVYLALHTYISNYAVGKYAHLFREICLSCITHIYLQLCCREVRPSLQENCLSFITHTHLQLYYKEVRPSLQGNMSILHYTHISPIMLQGSTSIFIGNYVYHSLHTYISNYTIGNYVHLYREICLSFITHIYLQLCCREERPSLQRNMSIFHNKHISPIILSGSTSLFIGTYV